MTSSLRRVKRLCHIQQLLSTQQEAQLAAAARRTTMYSLAGEQLNVRNKVAALERMDPTAVQIDAALFGVAMVLQQSRMEEACIAAQLEESRIRQRYIDEKIRLDQMTIWRDDIAAAAQKKEELHTQKRLDDIFAQRHYAIQKTTLSIS